MKPDKRNKRSALKKKQRTIKKQRDKSIQAQSIREEVERIMEEDASQDASPKNNPESSNHKLLWYVGMCKSGDAFPPWVMGKLLGNLHWSKVNKILDEMGFQHPKETGKRRVVTSIGAKYCAGESTSGLTWKLSTIRLISTHYDLPFDMPEGKDILNANLALSSAIKFSA